MRFVETSQRSSGCSKADYASRCLSESSCPDVQMGFCMETTGMTQGGQGEPPSDLEVVAGSLEEPEFKDETESMEDGHDAEV